MDRFLRQAHDILEIAGAAADGPPLAILIERQGGMRVLDPSGWSLCGLAAEFGASEVYCIERRRGSVRVEGWAGGRRCLVERAAQPCINASSEKSVGHRYAPMAIGSPARPAREPDVG